jgi:hypothetical protein
MALDEGVRGVMNFLRWRAGHWRELRLLSRAPAPLTAVGE